MGPTDVALMLCIANLGIGQVIINVAIVVRSARSEKHLLDKRDKMTDAPVKISYALLQNFKLMFNVTINHRVHYCPHGDKQVEDFVIDKLLSGEADISAFPLMLSRERIKKLAFPALSVPGTAKLIFRQPKLSYITNVYTLPFDTHVWYSSLALIILLTCILYAVTKWEWHKVDAMSLAEMHDTQIADSFLDVLFVTIGAISQQGSERSLKALQGRIVLWLLFMSLMFLFTSYSANIVALLQSWSNSIVTLRNLLESPLEVGCHDTETFRELIPQLTGADRVALVKSRLNFVNSTLGIARMRSGMYAFHVEASVGYILIEQTFAEDEKCGLLEIELLPTQTDLYFPIKKGSTFSQMFAIGFLKMKETGVHSREINLIHAKKPECWTTDSNFVSIGFDDCYFAVAILGGGVGLAVGIFLIELLLT